MDENISPILKQRLSKIRLVFKRLEGFVITLFLLLVKLISMLPRTRQKCEKTRPVSKLSYSTDFSHRVT